ncbi:unnamed protein product [Calypogeia fissa]
MGVAACKFSVILLIAFLLCNNATVSSSRLIPTEGIVLLGASSGPGSTGGPVGVNNGAARNGLGSPLPGPTLIPLIGLDFPPWVRFQSFQAPSEVHLQLQDLGDQGSGRGSHELIKEHAQNPGLLPQSCSSSSIPAANNQLDGSEDGSYTNSLKITIRF